MEPQPYTNREMDMKFEGLTKLLTDQNIILDAIDKKVGITNGKVGEAFKQIAATKSDVASNWRAIQVFTAIFILVVIPLCAVIYSNLQSSVRSLQQFQLKIQTK